MRLSWVTCLSPEVSEVQDRLVSQTFRRFEKKILVLNQGSLPSFQHPLSLSFEEALPIQILILRLCLEDLP